MPNQKLLFIGSLMTDVICPVDHLPAPGQGIVSEGFQMSLGGCAFNAAHAAKQLGAACDLLAPVGTGTFASFVRSQLAACGFSALEVDAPLDCGAAICLVQPSGERTMITLPGIERQFESSWFSEVDASGYGYAYLCGYELGGTGGDALLDFLEANPHLQVVFGPGPVICSIPGERMERMNALRPIWHLNEVEALSYTGCRTVEDAGRNLELASRNTVVVTEGPKGAHLFHRGSHRLIATFPVRSIDTIGAGDSHVGTLMAALALGKDLPEAVLLANKVSSAVCTVKGGTLSDEQFARCIDQ